MRDSTSAIQPTSRLRFGALSTRMWSWSLTHPLVLVGLVALLSRLALVATSKFFDSFVLDDGTYHEMAKDMAAGDISNWDDFTYSLFWRTATFLAPVTAIYKVFGPNITAAQVYVALIGAATAVVVTRLAMEFLETKWAFLVGLTVALLPSQAFWSSQLMKDASVWLVLATLALVIAIGNRVTGRSLLYCGLGVAALFCALAFLREHTLVVAAWATMIGALASSRVQRIHRIVGGVVLGVSIPWMVAAAGPAGLDLVTNAGSLETIRFEMARGANTAIVDTTPGGTEAQLNENLIRQKEITEEIAAAEEKIVGRHPRFEARLQALRRELAALVAQQDRLQNPPIGTVSPEESTSLEADVVHLPRGLSVMLIEPLPVPFTGSASLRLARLESLIWYPLLILAAIGLWNSRAYWRVLLYPVLCAAGIVTMYALTEGNVGTAHRHRGEFVWAVILLAGFGLSRLIDRQAAGA